MSLNEKTLVTYYDDGSKKQDIGSFSEQGLTINGRFRALPVLQILLMLEVAGNVSSKAIFEKLDFIETDQSLHNLEIDKKNIPIVRSGAHFRAPLSQCSPNTYV